MPTAVNNEDVLGLELERVLPKVRTLFERDDKFWGTIEKRDVEKISNRQMRVPLEMAPGGAFQYFDADGGDLGRGGGPTWDKATLSAVFMSEGIEYTKLAQWGTDDARKAVVQVVRRLIATAADEFRRQLDSQAMQKGNGVVGTISGVTTAGGSDTYACATDGFGVRLMRQGQTIQVFSPDLNTLRGKGTITSWDVQGKSVVVTPAIANAATNDLIVVNGISSPNSLPGIFGVPYHDDNASSGTWLGFNRATTPEIRASRVNAGGNALTLPLPRLAVNMIGNRVGIDNNFSPEAWMHPCQKQAYEEIGQLVSVIYKKPTDEKLDMYFDEMQLAGMPVRVSFNWNQKRIDLISKEIWGRGEILPLGFYMTDGRKIFELRSASGGVSTSDIFYMVIGTQLFVNNPAACAYIDNLEVPEGY